MRIANAAAGVSMVLLAGLLTNARVGVDSAVAAELRRAPKIRTRVPNVRIAPLTQLRDDPEATRILVGMLARLRSKVKKEVERHGEPSRYTHKEWPLGVSNEDMVELAEFARTHHRSRAALLAKFMIGHCRCLNRGFPLSYNWVACRECFEDIVKNYPDTREALLSRLELVHLDFRERLTKTSVLAWRDALQAALPALQRIDEDNDPLVVALRLTVVDDGTPNTFVARTKVEIAYIEGTYAGRIRVAIDLLSEVTREYRGTEYGDFAELGISNLKDLQESKKRQLREGHSVAKDPAMEGAPSRREPPEGRNGGGRSRHSQAATSAATHEKGAGAGAEAGRWWVLPAAAGILVALALGFLLLLLCRWVRRVP